MISGRSNAIFAKQNIYIANRLNAAILHRKNNEPINYMHFECIQMRHNNAMCLSRSVRLIQFAAQRCTRDFGAARIEAFRNTKWIICAANYVLKNGNFI